MLINLVESRNITILNSYGMSYKTVQRVYFQLVICCSHFGFVCVQYMCGRFMSCVQPQAQERETQSAHFHILCPLQSLCNEVL